MKLYMYEWNMSAIWLNNFIFDENRRKLYNRVEITVENGETARYE